MVETEDIPMDELIMKLEGNISAMEEEQKLALEGYREKIDILKKYNGQKHFTEEEKEDILSLLCYDDLGFCCATSKPCLWRNAVMELFGISPEKFKKVKEDAGRLLLV
jgi:predicted metal-binding transcription factor (methanogenesis marker protein 9)